MRHIGLAAAGLILLSGASMADPVFGTWRTEAGDGGNFAHVSIAECGGMICGTLGTAFDRNGNPVPSDKLGKRLIWDMSPEGGGKYSGGKIWAPDRDKTYSSKMELSGDALRVSGCVGPICRGQTWTRVK
ncbi:DUF2147 domain-containing protein [Tropicimonas marinistellae]|uniref:DUF2147 domain-containing protein n=1 Tax=Tropicimonas marinistellae TaxID=1739787 RepID=UPI000A96E02D|nr:DUF2147 domain-containing protein [Tropicimonas marinistellae]